MFRFSQITAAAWFEPLRGSMDRLTVAETNQVDRPPFRDLPRAARLWVIVTIATYLTTAVWVAPHTRLIVLTALVPVFALAALMKPVPHPLGGIRTSNSGALIAALMWTPPEVILGVGIGSIVGQRVFRRTQWWNAINNAASWGLSGGVDAIVAQSVMSILPPGAFRIVAGASAVMLAHTITNRTMFSLLRSYRFRRPFLREWRQSLSSSWPQELLELPAVVVITAVAFSLNDLAWSLAIATVTTLLLPLDDWIERSCLDIVMRKRAAMAPAKAQALVSEPSAGGSSEGDTRRSRTLFRLPHLTATGWFESLRVGLDGSSVSETSGRGRLAFRDLPGAARIWVVVMTAAYIGTAAWLAPRTQPTILTALIPIFALAALVKPLPHPGGGIQAANSGISMIAALMWMPPEVILGIGMGSFVGERAFRRVEWWRAAYNAASWGLTGGVAAVVALSVTPVLPHGMVRIIVGASAVMLVHLVTNRAMFSVYRSCRFRRPFLYEWRQSLSFSWPQELLELPAVLLITGVAYSLNDFAWSLAVAMATTLLVPVERRMNRSSLDIVMRKRARVAPVKAQGLVSGLTTSGSSPGITRRMRTCWAQLLHRLFDGGEGSSDNRASDLFPSQLRYFQGLLLCAYAAAACLSIPSSRLQVVAGLTIIFAAVTTFGFIPNPRGAGRIWATTNVKIVAILLFLPGEVVLGVGIGSFIGYSMLLSRGEAWRATTTASAWGLSAGAAALVAHFALSWISPYAVAVTVAALFAVITFRTINEGVWALHRSLFLGYPFPSEWVHGVFARWAIQTLDVPAAVGGTLVAQHFGNTGAALATTAASALLVPLARWELGHHYDRAVHSRAAAVLWQSETRFRALVEHLSEGISLINAEGAILYLSPSAHRILGYRGSRQIGRSWFELYHPEDSARLKTLFSSVVRDPGSHFAADARMLHTDGSSRWVHTVHTNLLMEPSVQAIVVTYHDITQVRHSEETLEEYAARLEDLSRRLVQTQEMERRQIAQELHDETGQILTGLKLTLDVAFQQIGEGEAKSTLSRAAAMLETLNRHVRTLSLNLRPTALDDLGLLPAVLLLCDQYAAQTSVQVKVIHSGISGRRFAPEIETTAYRIIQEGLTNVARHAGVREATARLWTDEEILGIQVEDCGRGFDIEAAKTVDRSSGLSGMRERASLVGGELTIESTLGTGTRLTAELPFHQMRTNAIVGRDRS